MSEVKVGDTAMGAVNVVRYNWQVIAKFGMIPLICMVVAAFLEGLGLQGLGSLFRLAAMITFVPVAVNLHKFTRAVADGQAPDQPGIFQWGKTEWIYLALIVGMTLAAGIIAGILGWMFVAALGIIGGVVLTLLIMLPICYILTRLSFVFPQDVFEAKVDLGKSWSDTGPQHINIFLSYIVVLLIFMAIQFVIGFIGALLGVKIIAAIFGILLGIVSFYGWSAFVSVVTLAHKAAAT